MADRLLLLAHAGATLSMVGLMWSVQLVVYPQFREVGVADFSEYAARHANRIVAALAPFAPIEALTALLIFVLGPDGIPRWEAFVAGAVLAVGWVATGFHYAPLHGRLQAEGADPALIEHLVTTNWFRTVLWVVRGGLRHPVPGARVVAALLGLPAHVMAAR